MVPQYYDSENISESRLSFRRATSEPAPDDSRPNGNNIGAFYGMNM